MLQVTLVVQDEQASEGLIIYFYLDMDPPPPDPTTDHPAPLKIILMPNIFNKNEHIYLQPMFRLSFQLNAFNSTP